MSDTRQQVLIVYMATSALTSQIIAWSSYDGSSHQFPAVGTEEAPPYDCVLEAMRDGWRVLQLAPRSYPTGDLDEPINHLKYEVVLERQRERQRRGGSLGQ